MFRLSITMIVAAALGGCSMVDDHLGSRVVAVNKGAATARNDSILLNIIRASDSQPLSFVALSKISGTQSSDLKFGLPTITIGKSKTAAQKQLVFDGTVWENSASSSFDSAPLESGDFYKAMSSSVDLGTMQALIRQGYSRELVFSALIGSIRVDGVGGPSEYRNDPLLDEVGCPDNGAAYGNRLSNGAKPFAAAIADYAPSAKGERRCEFSRFEFLLEAALKWGLSIEAIDPPKDDTPKVPDVAVTVEGSGSKTRVAASAPPSAADDGKPAPKKFRFCFDRAYADTDGRGTMEQAKIALRPFFCGASAADRAGTKDALQVRFGDDEASIFTFDVRPRSGLALFRYLGHAYRAYDVGMRGPRLFWSDSVVDFIGSERMDEARLINVHKVDEPGDNYCFAKVSYFGTPYCVPQQNSTATKQIFSLLTQLIALDTTASALPTTLDVRVQ